MKGLILFVTNLSHSRYSEESRLCIACVSCYCNSSLCGGCSKHLICKLQSQSNTAFFTCRSPRLGQPIYRPCAFHWLPVHSRVQDNILLLSFKSLSNQAPLCPSHITFSSSHQVKGLTSAPPSFLSPPPHTHCL